MAGSTPSPARHGPRRWRHGRRCNGQLARRQRPTHAGASRRRRKYHRHIDRMVRLLPVRDGRRAGLPEAVLPSLESLRRHAGVVRHVLRRLRGPATRCLDLRPLRRPDRAQGDPDHHAAGDGHRDLPDRRDAHLQRHRPVGRCAADRPARLSGHRRRRGVGRLGADVHTYVLTYGTSELGLKRDFLLNAVLLAAIVSLFTTPLFGYLSDVIGRRRMYLIGAFSILVFAFPYIGMLNTKTSALVVLAVVLSIICHDMMYGPQAAYIAESFPTRLRYSGASLGYQLASIVAGGPAPLLAAWLLHTFNSGYAISVYLALTGVVSTVAAVMLGRVGAVAGEREMAQARRGPAWRPDYPGSRS